MQNATLSAILEALPDPVIAIGRDLRIVALNAGAKALFGDGREGRALVSVLRMPEVLTAAQKALSGQPVPPVSVVLRQKGDSLLEVVAAAIPTHHAAEAAALLSFRDMTAIDQARRMRSDFVANVSHELRSPLTALMGFIETLRGPAASDPEALGAFLQVMQTEAERMRRLIDDLLSLSRVEAVEKVRPGETVDLALTLNGIAEALSNQTRQNGQKLSISPKQDTFPVPGHSDQLAQVFRNLIENALKYGGGQAEVTIRAAEGFPGITGPVVRVDVTDHGPGIEAVHLPRLTERFYRVDNHRSRVLGGTGLGLAIVKHIVNRHRGRLLIKSQPGEGSTFSVVLPAG